MRRRAEIPRPTVAEHSPSLGQLVKCSRLVTRRASTSFSAYSRADSHMDILLTHGYFLYEDPKELQIMKPYPPLGILYICSHLRKKGVNVGSLRFHFFFAAAAVGRCCGKGPPSVMGIYANLMTRSNVVEILRVAKEAGWQTVVGGPEPSAYIDEYLDGRSRCHCHRRGRSHARGTGPSITVHIPAEALHRVNGIAFRLPTGHVVRTKPREQIRDIDAQPWPARESIDMAKYVAIWR